MRNHIMAPYQHGLFSDFFHFLNDLAPGVVVLIALGLMILGGWLGYRTLPLFRAMRAQRHAPEQDPSHHALLRTQLRFWARAGVAYLCVILGLWVVKTHLQGYPSSGAFLHALAERPFQTGAALRAENTE